MATADYWWFLFGGVFLLILGLQVYIEKRKKDAVILQRVKPLDVLRRMLLIQVTFYAFYFPTLYTFNLGAWATPFSLSQIFDGREFTFVTARGTSSFMALLVTFWFSSVGIFMFSPRARDMFDYSFTMWFIHFLVVSAVSRFAFIDAGVWWLGSLGGLLLTFTFAERMGWVGERMTYLTLRAKRERRESRARGRRAQQQHANCNNSNNNNNSHHNASNSTNGATADAKSRSALRGDLPGGDDDAADPVQVVLDLINLEARRDRKSFESKLEPGPGSPSADEDINSPSARQQRAARALHHVLASDAAAVAAVESVEATAATPTATATAGVTATTTSVSTAMIMSSGWVRPKAPTVPSLRALAALAFVSTQHGEPDVAIAQLPGKYAAAAPVLASAFTISAWSASHGVVSRLWEPNADPEAYNSAISDMLVVPSLHAVAAANQDDFVIRLWDLSDNAAHHDGRPQSMYPAQSASLQLPCLFHLQGHEGTVRALSLIHGGHAAADSNLLALASGGDDKTVRVWNLVTGTCTWKFDGHGAAVTALLTIPGASPMIASAGMDKRIIVWSVNDGERKRTISTLDDTPMRMTLLPNRPHIVSVGTRSACARVWDLTSGAMLMTFSPGDEGGQLNDVCIVSGMLLAAGRVRGTGALFVFPPDPPSGSRENTTSRLSQVPDVVPSSTLLGHAREVLAVAALDDAAPLVASTGADRTLRIWSLRSGDMLARVKDHDRDAMMRRIAPLPGQHAQTWLATLAEPGSIKLWRFGSSSGLLGKEDDSPTAAVAAADGDTEPAAVAIDSDSAAGNADAVDARPSPDPVPGAAIGDMA